ncbi:MAG: type IV secretory system conjugative DNA transfer family protein [Tenericutes bacterium]|nr:type IV secretory system conjugative DNA transfer family protein [Mycoplasmatota bacterium]
MKDIKLKFTAKPKDTIIFVIFCIFLLYLVAIGVLNLYEIAHNNMFWGLNPIKAFSSEFLVTTLVMYLFALIAVFMSTSSYFFDREKGFGFGKKKDKDEPGWSRWMKDDEMKKAYDIKEITLKNDTYEHAGIPIILEEDKAWVDDGENHSLIIGASGSGKTWTIIDPLVKILGKAGESMIVTDPKGEIYENNANMLREKGYNVIIVNFRDPEHGSAWNPLTLPYRYWKQGKEDKAMELLEDLATNILVDANNNDPFWQKTAADYFTGLALGLFEDAKSEKEINLNSINAMSTFGEERCGASKYDKEYFKLKGELSSAYISAAATITAPADTKGGITSTFRQKVRIFSSRQKLAEMLSYTDFDVTRIGKEKTAVFLKIHDEKTTYHALATIFVKQVYECLIDEAQKEENLKLKIRTNFILDEFANMPALKDVESMITASRSRNMRFTFGIQNFSQLNKVYGKDVAETIKGNCGNMFYLITTEYAALEEISKLLGDVKPKDAKEGKPQPPIRPLVTVSDLQQMKKFEMIIKRFRNMPFKTKHKASFEIFKSKKGGWGYEPSISTYPLRESHGIETFDLKKYVDEHRTEESGGFNPFGSSPFVPPFGMPNMSKGMNETSGKPSNIDELVKNIDAQIAKLEEEEKLEKEKKANNNSEDKNEFENLVNKKYEEFINASEPEKPKLQNEIFNEPKEVKPENGINVDDLIKKIDAKIAELEKEEALAKNDSLSEVSPFSEKEIANEKFEEAANLINDDIIKDIEKPKINIDADSIVVDDNITDDEFFDDFFGDDE